MEITLEQVQQAVECHLPGRAIQHIDDLGSWIRHHFRITLDGGQVVFLKVDDYPNLDGLTEKEAFISQLLRDHDLPGPRVLAVDTTRSVMEYEFLIQEALPGTRLDRLLRQADQAEACHLYEAVGRFYRRLHAITYERSGYIMGPGEVLTMAPNDYMHRAVIVENGRRAVEQGLIPQDLHERAIRVSESHLAALKDHTPSLIGGGLPWTIALERDETGAWQVVRLMDLPDLLYWDPVFDLSFLRYPPYATLDDRPWQAFLAGYGTAPAGWRLALYRLIQCVDNALGNYLAPADLVDAGWVRRVPEIMTGILDEIENAPDSPLRRG